MLDQASAAPTVGLGARLHAALDDDCYFTHMPLLTLTTSGARTGQPHRVSLAYLEAGGRYVVIAANRGAPRHPDWYRNLVTRPAAGISIGDADTAVWADIPAGEQRDSLFGRFVAACPQVMLYQSSTSRLFPVVTLIPRVPSRSADHR